MSVAAYKDVPVQSAKAIAVAFDKDWVIILARDRAFNKVHTTTYGVSPQDKIESARIGDALCPWLGLQKVPLDDRSEDFRRDQAAAKNAQFRDLADGLLHCLRAYQHGNAARDLAKDFADKLENLIKSTNPA